MLDTHMNTNVHSDQMTCYWHEILVNFINYFLNIFCDKHPAIIIVWLGV